jgi:hypothetical protein
MTGGREAKIPGFSPARRRPRGRRNGRSLLLDDPDVAKLRLGPGEELEADRISATDAPDELELTTSSLER